MLEAPLEQEALVHAFGLPTVCAALKIPNLAWTRRTVLRLFLVPSTRRDVERNLLRVRQLKLGSGR